MSKTTYVYRGDGKRAWKELANGERTYFYYLGEQRTATSDGVTRASLVLWGADGIVGTRNGNDATQILTRFYFLYDTQGNLAQTLDGANGNVVSQSAVSAWGEPLRDNAGNQSSGGYGAKFGYLRDSESGFYLCTLRYYDPSAGRWITRDPIGYAGGGNLYGYAGNDPVNMSDPSGLAPAMWDMGTGGGLPDALIGVGYTYIEGNWLQEHTGVSAKANGPNGYIGKEVALEIAEATKYLQGKGYNVTVDYHLSIQDLATAAKNPNLKAFFFIGHSDIDNFNPIFFNDKGDKGNVSPNQIVSWLGGKKFDWVTFHTCNTNRKQLKDAFVGPKGKWWASSATYDPLGHKDLGTKPNPGGGRWKNFAN